MMAHQSAGALCLVLTTEGDTAVAEDLARELLDRHLVACATMFAVRSTYRWSGELEHSDEVQMLLKTTPRALGVLRSAIDELHSYETPEFIVLEASGSHAYEAWVGACVVLGGGGF